MSIINHRFNTILLGIVLSVLMAVGLPASALAASAEDFIVVLDAGHGGKDHGAVDNGTREKDINLAVALRLGEFIKKKLKDTKVVYTRDDDTFVSLQGRADIANKAKADLFISIHTNSVDTKNRNRRSVAGASVYTQGGHKDEANLAVAQRENSVIELENGYEQKYSGFDPNKVESYIIFEMAAKQNLAQSHRFAKNVQDNLVSIAGRADRGVHQAGFWVLWATSMPSALVELDFICNPESAEFMTSKAGVDKLAEAIFEAVKTYEKNFRQKQRMIARERKMNDQTRDFAADVRSEAEPEPAPAADNHAESVGAESGGATVLAMAMTPESDDKDLSHANLQATRNQQRARHASDGRRRRSAASRSASVARDLAVNTIVVREEFTGETTLAEVAQKSSSAKDSDGSLASAQSDSSKKKSGKTKGKKEKKTSTAGNASAREADKARSADEKRQWVAEVNKIALREKADKKRQSGEKERAGRHAGSRKSLRSNEK